jgi:hypothetical protein
MRIPVDGSLRVNCLSSACQWLLACMSSLRCWLVERGASRGWRCAHAACVHRLVQIACKAVLKHLPAESPEGQRLWPCALVLAAAHAVAYAKKHLDR